MKANDWLKQMNATLDRRKRYLQEETKASTRITVFCASIQAARVVGIEPSESEQQLLNAFSDLCLRMTEMPHGSPERFRLARRINHALAAAWAKKGLQR